MSSGFGRKGCIFDATTSGEDGRIECGHCPWAADAFVMEGARISS